MNQPVTPGEVLGGERASQLTREGQQGSGGSRRGKGTFGRFIVRITLGEEVIVACLGDCENTAPGKFSSEKLGKSQPCDVRLVPGGPSHPPCPRTPSSARSQPLLVQIRVVFLIKEKKILREFCFLNFDLSPKPLILSIGYALE